ncbi:MAG: dihydrofolate reductase [Pseudomonadota bacterium]
MTRVEIVVAMDENNLIGRDGQLPWRLSDDLKRFKTLTLGKTVLMGRKTWDSLNPKMRPLPQRDNWVLTRDRAFAAPGGRVFHALDEVFAASPPDPLMVVGGADLYRQVMPQASRIHLTRVHARVAGDTHFPALDSAQWRETAREDHTADERHEYAFSFITLDRV